MIDIYKIGVSLNMHGNSHEFMGVLLKDVMGVHVRVDELRNNFDKLKGTIIAAGAVFAGAGIIHGLVSATEHAAKLNHELSKLAVAQNLSPGQVDAVSTDVSKMATTIPGANIVELVQQRRELASVLGSMDAAKTVAPLIATASLDVGSFTDKNVDLAQIAMKAIENRGQIGKDGHIDVQAFTAELAGLTKAIISSGGLVTQDQLLQFIKQAGPAARTMSPDAMWGMAPAMMNAMGASKAGTAMMSLFGQFIGHTIQGQRTAIAMENAGMLTPGTWRAERGGHIVMDQNAVPDQAGLMANPFVWIHDHLQALHKRKGADEVGIVQQIFQLSSRQTAARLINDIDTNWPTIQNELLRYHNMGGIQDIRKEQNATDPSVAMKNLDEAWNTLVTDFGKPGVGPAIDMINGLASAINRLDRLMVDHPQMSADLFDFAGGLGALLAVGGGLKLAKTALEGFNPAFKLFTGTLASSQMSGAAANANKLGGTGGSLLGIAFAIDTLATTASSVYDQMKKVTGDPSQWPSNSPFWTGIPDDQQKRYSNSPVNAPKPDFLGPERDWLRDHLGFGTTSPYPDLNDNLYHHSSYVPSGNGAGGRMLTVVVTNTIDGHELSGIVSQHQADTLLSPTWTVPGVDTRAAPLYPGDTIRI